MRILYVEDNLPNQVLIQRIAHFGNHQVINYGDGQSALDNFDRDKPDLVLMDVLLPGRLDGLDVVRALRAAGHKMPIIALTAQAMMGDRERCLQAGCNDYMSKPLIVDELIELLDRYQKQLAARADETIQADPAPEVQGNTPWPPTAET